MNKFKNLVIKSSEYALRRSTIAEVVSKNKSDNVIILSSADVQYKTNHIPRVYHQNTYFNYLTGFPHKNATLVIHSEADKHKSVLFIDMQDEQDKVWNGYYPSLSDASESTSIDNVLYRNELNKYLKSNLNRNTKLWSTDPNDINEVDSDFIKKFNHDNVSLAIDCMRLYKSESEINIMHEAGRITKECFESTMKFSNCNEINEHEILGKLSYESFVRGSKLAYPPVIGGGARSNTIHYLHGMEEIKKDELVLVDFGCDVLSYYADVTRTWPVSGSFTRHQALMYDILSKVFDDCVDNCTSDKTLNDLYQYMMFKLNKYLVEEKVLKNFSPRVCPHHIGHYLGLDIHDSPSVPTNRPLDPGIVFTLEPGIYFPDQNTLASLKIAPEFLGIGMRLEDDFVMKENGEVECLNEGLARSRKDIESLFSDEETSSIWESVEEDLRK